MNTIPKKSLKAGSLLLGAAAALIVSMPAFGHKLSLPPVANYDCMWEQCAKYRDAVKRSRSGVIWKLVAQQRNANGRTYQVWQDGSGLIWGDRLDNEYTHRKAITLDDTSGKVIKEDACGSSEGQRANAGIRSKKFGLPTIEEYRQAEKDGIRDNILPNMSGYYFLTASRNPLYADVPRFFYYGGADDGFNGNGRDFSSSVRCVGR